VPPKIAALLHIEGEIGVVLDAFDDDAGLDIGIHLRVGGVHSLVGDRFHRHRLVAAVCAVASDQSLAGGVDDTVGKGFGGEAAEDDRMHRADAGAGQHREGQFGDHRHIDRDAVALFDAARFEHIGEFADFGVHFAVGEGGVFTGLIAFPDNGGLLGPGIEVPVEAVVDDIGRAALEPFDRDGALVHIVIVGADFVPLFKPVELRGFISPKGFGVGDRAIVFSLVVLHAFDVGPIAEGGVGLVYFGHADNSWLIVGDIFFCVMNNIAKPPGVQVWSRRFLNHIRAIRVLASTISPRSTAAKASSTAISMTSISSFSSANPPPGSQRSSAATSP
jgi:hypothetical protein